MPYFTNSQGLDIYYEEKGKNNQKTILFLDGSGSSCAMNRQIANILKDQYHCVLMDYRGYGNSDPSRFNSMAWCAFDVKELIEHLDLEKVTLMGHSMGVSVALGYCKAYGMQYLDKLILCDQSPYVTSDGDWRHGRLQGRQDKDLFLKFVQQIFDNPDMFRVEEIPRMGPRYYTECEYPEEMLNNDIFDLSWVPEEDGKQRMFEPREVVARGMKADCDPLAYVATWFDSGYQDYRPILPDITVPVLYFAPYPGTEYDYASNLYYKEHLGGPVDFVELRPATHMAIYEHLELTIQRIREFMEREYDLKVTEE